MEKWSSQSQRRRHGGTGYLPAFDLTNLSPDHGTISEHTQKSRLLEKLKPKSLASFVKNFLKILGYFLCTVACVYQVTGFVELYLEYPSTMDIHVEFLNDISLPAATVCNINWYKREKVCDKYPEEKKHCEDTKKDFTLSNELRNTMTMETIEELSYNFEDIVTKCNVSGAADEKALTEAVCQNPSRFVSNFKTCYILNSQWNKLKEYSPNTTSSFKFILKLDSQAKTYMQPESNYPPELWLRVHNPYTIPLDTTNQPIKIRQDLSYSITITKSAINLLEPPFKPGCINYHKNWRENGGYGPLSREGCINECHTNISLQNCGCVASHMILSSGDTKCMEKNQNKCINVSAPQYQKCEDNCLSDCEMMILDLDVSKDFQDPIANNVSYSSGTESDVQIYMQTRRHMIYQHKPKITPVEILGYVGGYLSLWLGLSIPMVYDFFELSFVYTLQRIKYKSAKSASIKRYK